VMRRTRPCRRRGQAAAQVAVLLEAAAERAGRERTVVQAVRVAWDVLAAAGPKTGGQALAVWRAVQGFGGPVEQLFGAACLQGGSPSGVAGSLYRAAGTVGTALTGAVA
jgi:hypothetical protein